MGFSFYVKPNKQPAFELKFKTTHKNNNLVQKYNT